MAELGYTDTAVLDEMEADGVLQKSDSALRRIGDKTVKIHRKGRASCVSDHVGFERGVGVMALHRGKLGYWLGRTRTIRDKNLEYTNVNILRACLITYIGSHAAE